ncbi:hypothetical protein PA25_24720 [Pseudoalteromonas sp. A25]|nr:hypothetical protein PA25_24720 [Pseudoalteromonas sp. A25]
MYTAGLQSAPLLVNGGVVGSLTPEWYNAVSQLFLSDGGAARLMPTYIKGRLEKPKAPSDMVFL